MRDTDTLKRIKTGRRLWTKSKTRVKEVKKLSQHLNKQKEWTKQKREREREWTKKVNHTVKKTTDKKKKTQRQEEKMLTNKRPRLKEKRKQEIDQPSVQEGINNYKKKEEMFWIVKYSIQHCFIFRPSAYTLSRRYWNWNQDCCTVAMATLMILGFRSHPHDRKKKNTLANRWQVGLTKDKEKEHKKRQIDKKLYRETNSPNICVRNVAFCFAIDYGQLNCFFYPPSPFLLFFSSLFYLFS